MKTAPDDKDSDSNNSNPAVVVGVADQKSVPVIPSAGVTMDTESSSAHSPGRNDGRDYAAVSLPCSDPVTLQAEVTAAAAAVVGPEDRTRGSSNTNPPVTDGVADHESAPVLPSAGVVIMDTTSGFDHPPRSSSATDSSTTLSATGSNDARDHAAAPAASLPCSDPVARQAEVTAAAVGPQDRTRAHTPSPPFSSNYFTPCSSSLTNSSTLSASTTLGGGSNHAARDHEGLPNFTFLLALLAIIGSFLAVILAESKDTISGWSTGPKVVYGIVVVLSIALLAVGIMAAGRHVATRTNTATATPSLSVADFCAKLGFISSSAILVVVLCCKLGRWGCFAGVAPAAVIAGITTAVWAWRDEWAVARAAVNYWARLWRGKPAGDEESSGACNKV